MALTILSFTYFSAEATMKCKPCHCKPAHHKQVTTTTAAMPVQDKFAKNYAVCRADCGYFICNEVPNEYNTAPKSCAMQINNEREGNYIADEVHNEQTSERTEKNNAAQLIAPQSQSYPSATNPYATENDNSKKAGKIEVYYDNNTNAGK